MSWPFNDMASLGSRLRSEIRGEIFGSSSSHSPARYVPHEPHRVHFAPSVRSSGGSIRPLRPPGRYVPYVPSKSYSSPPASSSARVGPHPTLAIHKSSSLPPNQTPLGHVQATQNLTRPVPKRMSSSSSARRRFVVIKPLNSAARGNFNEGVYLVHDKNNSKAVYIEKRLKPRDVRDHHGWREVKALSCCDHPNIVGLIGSELHDISTGYGSIFMQYCELGSLHSCIEKFRQRNTSMPEGFIWSVFFQISLAVCYLQTGRDASMDARDGITTPPKPGHINILHRDMKPDNVFLTWRGAPAGGHPIVVLGDFGCSLKENHAQDRREISHRASRFQPCFAAPELPSWSTKSDIFSLGMTMSCVARLTGLPDKARIAEGRPVPRHYSPELQGQVEHCINQHPQDRPHATELPTLVYQCKKKAERRHGYTSTMPSWAFN